ncbi:MAG: SRPBCC domain-containing protein [Candidatus Kryptoniota bacterium]
MEAIKKRVLLNAPVDRVWKALTNPKELAIWMLAPTDFEPEIGRNFTFSGMADENWDGIIHCKVKEMVKNKKLAFTWDSALMKTETLVTIELNAKGKQTELTLVHSGWAEVPANAEMIRGYHDEGWDLRLNEKIKELVEA